jgi:hypothetical protein
LIIAILRGQQRRLEELRPDLPTEVTKIVMKAISYNKQVRYHSMNKLAESLKIVLSQILAKHHEIEYPSSSNSDFLGDDNFSLMAANFLLFDQHNTENNYMVDEPESIIEELKKEHDELHRKYRHRRGPRAKNDALRLIEVQKMLAEYCVNHNYEKLGKHPGFYVYEEIREENDNRVVGEIKSEFEIEENRRIIRKKKIGGFKQPSIEDILGETIFQDDCINLERSSAVDNK